MVSPSGRTLETFWPGNQSQQGKLLGDSAAVTAMLDRLFHHGHVLKCGPRSWRTKMCKKGVKSAFDYLDINFTEVHPLDSNEWGPVKSAERSDEAILTVYNKPLGLFNPDSENR
jgi:IstB-like ATP binding protein